jgi:hypothetical protein
MTCKLDITLQSLETSEALQFKSGVVIRPSNDI